MSLAAAPLRESAHSQIVQARDVHGHAAEDNLFTYTMPPDRPVPTHHVVIEDYFMSGDQSGSCFATQLTNSCSSGPTQVPRLNSGGDATDLCEDSLMDGSLDYMLPFQTPCAAPQHPSTSSPLAAQQLPIVFPGAMQAQSRDVGALAEALPLLGASQGSTPPMPRMLRQPCLAAPMSLAAAPLRESAHSQIVQARDVHGHAAEDNLFTYTMPPDRPVPTHHVVIEDYFMSGDQSGSCFATQLTNSCSSGPTQVPRLNSGGDATDLCEDSLMDGSLDYMLPFQTPCAAPQHPATSSPLAAQQSPIVFPAATEAGLRKCWTVRHSQASSEGRDAVGGLTSPGQWLESQARCGLGGMGLFTDTVYRLNSETEHGQTKELDATPQLAPHLTRCTAFAPEVSQSRNVVGLAEVMTSSGTSQKSAAMLGDSIRSQITQAKSADGCAAEDNFVAHAGALQKPTPGHASNRGQQGSCLATQQMEAGCMPSSCIETLASLQRQTSYASTCGQVWTSPPSSAPRQVAVPSIDNEIAEFFEDVLIQNSAQDSTSNPQHLFAAPQQGTICNPPMNMAWAQQVPVAFPAPEEATACIHTGACCSALPLELQGMGSLECMPRPQMSGMWREQTGVSGEAVQVSTASRTGAVIAMSSSRLS